jgi:hypothetical protein
MIINQSGHKITMLPCLHATCELTKLHLTKQIITNLLNYLLNLVHIFQSSFKVHLILCSHLCLGPPSGLLFFMFSHHSVCISSLPHTNHKPCPMHPLHLITWAAQNSFSYKCYLLCMTMDCDPLNTFFLWFCGAAKMSKLAQQQTCDIYTSNVVTETCDKQ